MKRKFLSTLLACACTLSCLTLGHAQEAPKPIHSEFVRVTDYVFEVTYDDYEQYYEQAVEFFGKKFKKSGCSAVQNGVIRGRNYDWNYDEETSFVIHVPATETRHAGVGICDFSGLLPEAVEADPTNPLLNTIPYGTVDGVNDAGLCININVVNYGEFGKVVPRTENPIFPAMIPRLVLDSCGTVEEALALIGSLDVGTVGTMDEAHYMITGKASATDDTLKTVVVEFIPDAEGHYDMSVIDKFVDDKPIMTNFHLTGFDGTVESLTAHPMGYERYLILKEAFDQGATVNGMTDLMKKVYFTRNYDLYIDNFWYSEYAQYANLTMADRGEAYLGGDISKAGAYAKEIAKEFGEYENRVMQTGDPTWITVHTSVYDLEKQELSFLTREGSIAYKFDLKGRIG
ncbi:MAG: carcinine hydrolase/isopenicillin-N N-acyltransferase family protein [Clostridia bacterium]|nr:carcinine hydrolase/isopenicillin-N N-acyltransferase family protein [Clostridia bacterium]